MKQIYLILKFIEQSSKKANPILSVDEFPLEQIGVSEYELNLALLNLYESDYIRGIEVIPTDTVEMCVVVSALTLTLEGLEYLEENSTMKKWYKNLKEAKEWIPGF
jgi:hypothetical protein